MLNICVSPPINFSLIKIFTGTLLRFQYMLGIYSAYTQYIATDRHVANTLTFGSSISCMLRLPNRQTKE